ncbi:Putative ATP-binding component of a transport system [Escherichia coli]|nr:Putative ATP-binding component of a transport system [Escherichia coli]STE51605.1 Putative ATP-binding component of a transport system [Escherichia coli]STE98627.1 Putative ATP-binding component of a transport system [Escherichia coli]
MNDAVITLNGLEKRFPGMDKPPSRRSIVPFTPVM